MVTASIASIDFNWQPEVVESDNPRVFVPTYVVAEEAETTVEFLISRFADLPSAGIWENRTKADDELLEELGSAWRGFATEQ